MRTSAYVALALTALSAVACGAKTGLPVPIDTTCREIELSAPTPQVMFVVDRSGSMDFSLAGLPIDDPDRGDAPSRWQLMSAALPGSLAGRDMEVGAVFFPTIEEDDVNACGGHEIVDVVPGEGNAQELGRIFDETDPIGGTPTGAALRVALEFFENAELDDAPFVVLVTDGAPNCNTEPATPPPLCECTSPAADRCNPAVNEDAALHCLDDTRALEEIDLLRAMNIPVFVLGLTQQPALAETLDRLAVAGGRPRPVGERRYYDARTETELTEAFDAINDSITNCVFRLSAAPNVPGSLRITVNGTPVEEGSGWRFSNREQTIVSLSGEACAAAEAPGAVVGADLFCAGDDV